MHRLGTGALGEGATFVPAIRCTGKLEAQVGEKLRAIPDVSAFDWHANLLWLDGKKHVLFCSDASRLTCITSAVSRSQIQDLPSLFKATLRGVMTAELFARCIIERVIAAHDPVTLARTSSRSVLGTINDNTQQIRFILDQHGSSARLGLAELHRLLNHMPMQPNGWKYAIEAFLEKVVATVC